MKNKILQIDIAIYEQQVFCTFSKKGLDVMCDALGVELVLNENAAGTTYNVGGAHVIHFQSINPGIVAHEAIHTAHGILKHAGVETSHDNDEAVAYLAGYIVENIHQGVRVPKRKEYKW